MTNPYIIIIILLFFFIISGQTSEACESHAYFSATQEYNLRSGDYRGDYPTTFELGYRYNVGEASYIGPFISHRSNVARGWPFNNSRENPETWNDSIGLRYEKRFYGDD